MGLVYFGGLAFLVGVIVAALLARTKSLALLLFAITNWIGWTAGVGVGAALRRAERARRELQDQRGAVSSRH